MARAADHAALAALFLWAAVYATRRLGGADYWWHLAFGRYIWETGVFPEVDVFTFTAYGKRWVNISWLIDLLMYGMYRAGGLTAIGALKTALVLGATIAMAWAGHRRGRSVLFILPAALALALHWPRFVVRPFLVTSLFAALTIALLERDRRRRARDPTSSSAALWWCVPMVWFWACTHGAFVMLWCLLGAYGVEVLVQQRPPAGTPADATLHWRRRVRGLALLGLVCVAVTLAQPYTVWIFWRISVLFGSAYLQAGTGEWQPMARYAALSPKLALLWYSFLALTVVSFMAAGRRISVFRVLAVAGPGYLAFTAVRHLDVFLYVGAPLIAANLHDAWDTWGERIHRRWPKVRRLHLPLTLAWAVVVLTAIGIAINRYTRPRLLIDGEVQQARAWAVRPFTYPEGPVSHLIQHPTGGRPFNEFEQGGYLLWHQFPEPVFIDSKGLDEVQIADYVDTLQSAEAFAAATERFNLRAVVMTLAPRKSDLYLRLVRDPAWTLEVFDPTGYLFTRRTAPLPPVSRPPGDSARDLAVFVPAPLPPLDSAALPTAPAPLAELTEGRFWAAAEMPRRAATAYAAAVRASPHSGEARLRYAEMLGTLDEHQAALLALIGLDGAGGRRIRARAALVHARAARATGDPAGALAHAEAAGRAAGEPGYELRLELRLQQGDAAGAVAEGRRWVRRYRRSATARNNLAVALNASGDTRSALREIDTAIALAPARGDIQYTRGLILEAAGDAAGAAAAYAEARRLGFAPQPDAGR